MIYKKIKPNISFAKEDVDMIKIALKRQGGMGIKRASELYEALDFNRISNLQSERRGYWKRWSDMGADFSINWNYFECSCCGNDVRDLSWGDFSKSKMPQYADSSTIPLYCSFCGSLNTIALRPSEYYSYLSYIEDEDERRLRREALKDEVKKYIEKSGFDIANYAFSTEEKELYDLEVLEAFEQYVGQENIPLFDKKGGIVYG